MKNFEQRLKRLEDLASSIKDGDIPLEQALTVFEEGVKLAQGLEKDLDKIENKVKILMNQPLEESAPPELELFTDLQ